MALAASMQWAWPRVIALYKFLWNLRSTSPHPSVFARPFRRFVVLLKFLWTEWKIWYGKQRRPKAPGSSNSESSGEVDSDQSSKHLKEVDDANVDQMVIPLDNIACSMNPYGTGVHDASRSSQMLNASRSSHNLGIISRSRNTSFSSHNISSKDMQSPLGGGYTFTVQPTSPRRTYSMSSPELGRPHAADIHEAILHHPRIPQFFSEPRSDSPVESIQLVSSGGISRSRVPTPASKSEPPIQRSTEIPYIGAVDTSSHFSSGDLEIPALDQHHIYPVAPEHLNDKRYEKRRRIPNKATRVKMKPMLIDFSDRSDPPGWILCTHPEGACYFFNAEKSLRIFTDVDLYDSTSFERIIQDIDIIENFIASNHIQLPKETDLVLDLNLHKGDLVTDYYFANHQLRTVFFLDDFSSNYLLNWEEIKGVSSGRHLQYEMEAQYWSHCVTYPNALQLTDDLVCRLRDIVMHFIGDSMTSPYATSPYTLDDLYKILSLADGLKENIGKPYSGCTSLLSRLMFVFSHMKFLHFHGQPEARLNRDQSVYGTRTNKRTWFIKTISFFLFSAPDVHLKILQKMWVDGIMHKAVWQTSLKKVNDEWREFILYATVMLNANVAFLGKQSAETNRSPAQISSYCSITASIGSIILGLLLVRQNQIKNRETLEAVDAQRFMRTRAHPLLGLETLAIMFSLPYALLMWSMVSFLTAFLLVCLQDSNTVARSIITSLSGVIAVLIVWCIWTSWEKHPDSDAENPQGSLPFEKDDVSEGKSKKFTFEVVVPEPTQEFLPSIAWFPFPHRRRQSSHDSNKTFVEDP